MKKAIEGGSRRGKESTRRDSKGQSTPRRGSSEMKPVEIPEMPFFAANEKQRYKALKSQCETIESFRIGDSAKKTRSRNSTKTPTIWEIYNGWVRDENYRPRFALEALDAEARKEMFSNPPVERKYEGLCNILDVMEDTLAFANNPEQSASVRDDALALFHFLDNLLIYGLAGVDFITIATMAFTCGVVATRLRQPEVMKAAHEGDIAHRRRVLGGKNRAKPKVWEQRLRIFKSLKIKKTRWGAGISKYTFNLQGNGSR